MVSGEKVDNQSNSDPDNSLDFEQVFSISHQYMKNKVGYNICNSEIKVSKKHLKHAAPLYHLFFSLHKYYFLPKLDVEFAYQLYLFFLYHFIFISAPRSTSSYSVPQSMLSDVAQSKGPPNISVPEYLLPLIPRKLAAPMKLCGLSFRQNQ